MSLTLTEARARASRLAVHSYAIHLTLTGEDSFESRTTVRFAVRDRTDEVAEQVDWQFAEVHGARTLRARLDGEELPAERYDGRRLRLGDLGPGDHELAVDAVLPTTSDGDGMHRFTDPADGSTYVSAYLGMDLAQRVFACFDQPDLKAPVTLTVTAPPEWTVLANGVSDPVVEPAETTRVSTGSTATRWRFATTPPLATYLFVVCAGPWHSVRWEHAGLPFGLHCRRSMADRLDREAPALRELTERCFDHYTTAFDEPYAFDSYDQAFVPEHNWGALETPGCVTFRDEYLTRSEPTAAERLDTASVVAHEMAHMWFGDLVTMRWWEDSWLNESFADYMGYQVAGEAAGFTGAWVEWALRRKPTAYVADARRSTHPVAEDTEAMTDVDTAFGNFDMITYAKGNAVLRQLATWLGEDDFLAGVNRYLSAHPFGNATLVDFLAALDEVTERDTRAWAEAWLRTTGFDTVRVEREDAAASSVPVLHRDGSRPHRLTVAAYDEAGTLLDTRTVDLADGPLPLPEYAGRAVVPNSLEETYARVHLDDTSWRTVARSLSSVTDPLTRAMLWMNAVDRTAAGLLPVPELLALVPRHLATEADPLVIDGVLNVLLRRVLRQWTGPEEVAAAREVLAGTAAQLLDDGPASVSLVALRTLAATTADVDALHDWLDTGVVHGVPLPADERWAVLRRLAELDAAEPSLVSAELARDSSATGRLGALRANAAVPHPAAKAAAWRAMHASGVSNRDYEALSDGLWCLDQGELLREWVERYLTESPALARSTGQAMSRLVGATFPFVALPEPDLRALRGRLATALEGDLPTVLRRSWNDRLDDLDAALRVRTSGR